MSVAESVWLATLSSVHALRWLRGAALAVVLWLWSSVYYLAKHKGTKLECIQRDVRELQKLPVHLAFVVNEKDVSYVDLAKLVNWSFGAGILHVSLYDNQGILRSSLETIRQAVEQEHQNLFPESNDWVVECQTQHHQKHKSQSQQAGGVHSVLILCPEDGCAVLTDVATSLCGSVLQQRCSVEDIDSTMIERELADHYPDPSVAVVCGEAHSLLGYLPWHTRLTEILFIHSHHKITYQQFYCLLCQYANTTQRLGK